MKRSVVIERLGYEASAGWTTYGTSLAAFSLFQGVARDLNDSSKRQPRRNEEREGCLHSFFVFFASSRLMFILFLASPAAT